MRKVRWIVARGIMNLAQTNPLIMGTAVCIELRNVCIDS